MPTKRWLLMLVLSLIPVGALIYHEFRYEPPSEFDAPNNALVSAWSRQGTSCQIIVVEKSVVPLRADYKMATACLLYDGKQDILDAPYLQVGGLYDIDKYGGTKTLIAGWSDFFTNYFVQKGGNGVYVALLLVPNGVEPYQFTTLRQARAIGVRIPQLDAATSDFPKN